jgi:hypothetical protein
MKRKAKTPPDLLKQLLIGLGLGGLLLLGLDAGSIGAAGNTYYVSMTDGADSNSGLSATPETSGPFKTIARVNSLALQPGDSVRFKCGDTWRAEMLVIDQSGATGSPLTFGSYPTATCADPPVLSGAQPISGWAVHTAHIYVADLTAGVNAGKFGYGVNQLFKNTQRLPFGRWPNPDQFDHGYSTIDSQPGSVQIRDNELPAGNWSGASAHIKGMRWYILNRQVSGSSGATLTFTAANDCWSGNCTGWGYWLNNHLSTLDQEGEWYYDAATHKLYLYTTGGSPGGIEGSVILKNDTRSWGGIQLGADLTEPGIAYVVVDNLAVTRWFRHGLATPTNHAHYENHHLTLQNNRISEVDGIGINLAAWVWGAQDGRPDGWRGGYNLTVSGNTIDTANQRGIDAYSRNSTFTDNIIRNVALIANLGQAGMGCPVDASGGSCTEDGDGFRLKTGQPADSGNSNTLRYNRLEKSGYNGLDIFGYGNTVEYNIIEEACSAKGDCGGVRTFGSGNLASTAVHDLAFRQNLIINTPGNTDGAHSTYRALFGFGFYIDHYSRDIELTGNTVISATVHGALYQDSTGQMSGNTLYANNLGTMSGGQVDVTAGPALVQPFTGNILYALRSDSRTLLADIAGRLGGSNNNYFFNPYQNSHIYVQGARTLAQWQSYSGMDGASKSHWFTLAPADPPNSVIFYNDTKTTRVVDLGHRKYLNLDQQPVTGSLSLAPFTSRVLIDSGETALAPLSLAFDTSASPAQTVTLKNITGSPLTLTGLAVTPGFTITGDTCPDSPATLAANATCAITIRFTSAQSGVSGALTISHSAGSAYTASLFGGWLKTHLPVVLKE